MADHQRPEYFVLFHLVWQLLIAVSDAEVTSVQTHQNKHHSSLAQYYLKWIAWDNAVLLEKLTNRSTVFCIPFSFHSTTRGAHTVFYTPWLDSLFMVFDWYFLDPALNELWLLCDIGDTGDGSICSLVRIMLALLPHSQLRKKQRIYMTSLTWWHLTSHPSIICHRLSWLWECSSLSQQS